MRSREIQNRGSGKLGVKEPEPFRKSGVEEPGPLKKSEAEELGSMSQRAWDLNLQNACWFG